MDRLSPEHDQVSSPGVTVVHRPTIGLLGVLAMLLAAAIAWWAAARRPLALGVAAGVLAVTALLVPIAVAVIASGACWACCFAWRWGWCAARTTRRRRPSRAMQQPSCPARSPA